MKKLDIIITVIVLAIGAAGYLIYSHAEGGADNRAEAEIYIGDELIDTVSLDEDREFEVSRDGTYNLVEVSGGKIRVAEADCPDKTCVHTGAKGRAGDLIVCLPNRLQIKIKGGSEDEPENGVDAISG
ncbi:MAG: NusG domain II-containing protein [Clostridiales Family XIII bacterium]|jgi:hypothetical protein|nr:NusG domain II-containing protein [Clostridiales Family XIII bacterium]